MPPLPGVPPLEEVPPVPTRPPVADIPPEPEVPPVSEPGLVPELPEHPVATTISKMTVEELKRKVMVRAVGRWILI
jgi:hypothetical protein